MCLVGGLGGGGGRDSMMTTQTNRDRDSMKTQRDRDIKRETETAR